MPRETTQRTHYAAAAVNDRGRLAIITVRASDPITAAEDICRPVHGAPRRVQVTPGRPRPEVMDVPVPPETGYAVAVVRYADDHAVQVTHACTVARMLAHMRAIWPVEDSRHGPVVELSIAPLVAEQYATTPSLEILYRREVAHAVA